MNLTKAILLLVIAAYRKTISPLLPASCRFYPSCSQYAREAVVRYGVLRGSLMAVKRVTRCHPWHPGGFDPALKVTPARKCEMNHLYGATATRPEGPKSK